MVNLSLYAWTTRGKQRIAIAKALSHEMSPMQIYKKAKEYNEKLSANNTCDILRAFTEKGLVICLNPLEKTGRLYQLTKEGEEIRMELMKG